MKLNEAALFVALLLSSQNALAHSTVRIVLDPGHVPSAPGALGSCGTREMDLNDEAAVRLQSQLLASGYQVILTRQPGEGDVAPADSETKAAEVRQTLTARPALANEVNADLFVSLHHDATEDRYHFWDPTACDGRGGRRITPEFKRDHKLGFNVWVYEGGEDNKSRFAASLKLARTIGKHLLQAGFIASDYHALPTMNCNSCHPVDGDLGVWNQDLVVLKLTKMPAVLIEHINIDDPDLEAIANSPDFKSTFTAAVKAALDEFTRSSMTRSQIK